MHICNTCSLHEVEVTISGTITMTDLCFYLTHGPTNKTNVLAAIYIEQTFMFNVMCITIKKNPIVCVCYTVLSIVRYILSM